MANENLNPLEEDVHGTGKWNFRGKNLSPEEVERLTKERGVDWEKDVMPDGRLKLPKFRRKWYKSTVREPSIAQDDLQALQEARWKEYQVLPEPRRDYLEWAASRARRQQFDILEDIALNAGKTADRIKAVQSILEFSKSKPKTQVELSENREAFFDMSPAELLKTILELNGISFDKFQQFLNSEDAEVRTQ